MEETFSSNQSIGSADPLISTQDIYSVAGELIDAIMSEEGWDEFSDDCFSEMETIVDRFDKSFDDNSDIEQLLNIDVAMQEQQSIHSEFVESTSPLLNQQQQPDQIPSELYSPTSLSRCTTPASDDDVDDFYSQNSGLPRPIISRFDRDKARHMRAEEIFVETLYFCGTSQGNSFLSQSQKKEDQEKQPDDIKPNLVVENSDTRDDDDEKVVILVENELIEVKADQEEKVPPAATASTSKRRGSVKRKSYATDEEDDEHEKVGGGREAKKRSNNREAAKRYREKKKKENLSNKQKVAQLMTEQERLVNDIKAKFTARRIHVSLLESIFKNLPLPVYIA